MTEIRTESSDAESFLYLQKYFFFLSFVRLFCATIWNSNVLSKYQMQNQKYLFCKLLWTKTNPGGKNGLFLCQCCCWKRTSSKLSQSNFLTWLFRIRLLIIPIFFRFLYPVIIWVWGTWRAEVEKANQSPILSEVMIYMMMMMMMMNQWWWWWTNDDASST